MRWRILGLLFLSLPAGFLGWFADDRQMVVVGLGALAIGGMVVPLSLGFRWRQVQADPGNRIGGQIMIVMAS